MISVSLSSSMAEAALDHSYSQIEMDREEKQAKEELCHRPWEQWSGKNQPNEVKFEAFKQAKINPYVKIVGPNHVVCTLCDFKYNNTVDFMKRHIPLKKHMALAGKMSQSILTFFIITDQDRENVFCTVCSAHLPKSEIGQHSVSKKHTLAAELRGAGKFIIQQSYPEKYCCTDCKETRLTVGGIINHLSYGSCHGNVKGKTEELSKKGKDVKEMVDHLRKETTSIIDDMEERDKENQRLKETKSKLNSEKLELETEARELRKKLRDQKSEKYCCVCWDRPKNTVLLPCGHLCLCYECFRQTDSCPICRVLVVGYIKIAD